MLSPEFCAGAILAGGQSRRMGQCKALLPLQDGTMLEHITRQLDLFPERWLSANDPVLGIGFPGDTIADIYPGCGPLAGIHAVLSKMNKPWVLCVSCDMPRFSRELAAAMLAAFPPQADALICVDGTGQTHPLCGIYARAALPVLERASAGRKPADDESAAGAADRQVQNSGTVPGYTFSEHQHTGIVRCAAGERSSS